VCKFLGRREKGVDCIYENSFEYPCRWGLVPSETDERWVGGEALMLLLLGGSFGRA